MWLFSKQGDPSLDLPLEEPKTPQKKSNVDPQKVSMVTAMGFTEEQAVWGLGKTGEDVARCVDYLFSHAGEMEADLKA